MRAIIFVCFGILVATLSYLMICANIKQSIGKTREITEAQVDEYLSQADKFIEHMIDDVYSDLLLVAESEEFSQYLENPVANKLELQQFFQSIVTYNDNYRQLRFIDADGYEKIEIDSYETVSIVEDADLQYKGDQDYFIDTIALAERVLLISSLDLRTENGMVVVPCEPVIHFAVPVADGDTKIGMIVINYDGIGFLDIMAANEGYFDFDIGIGITDSEAYWSANGAGMSEFVYETTISNPDSPFFQIDLSSDINIIDNVEYYSREVNLSFDFDYYYESAHNIYLLANYDLDGLLPLIDNAYNAHPVYQYVLPVFTSLVLTLLLVFVVAKISSVGDMKTLGFISNFANDGILIANKNHHILFANRIFLDAFKYDDIGQINQEYYSGNLKLPDFEHNFIGQMWNYGGQGNYIFSKVTTKTIYNVFGYAEKYVALYGKPECICLFVSSLAQKQRFVLEVRDFFAKCRQTLVGNIMFLGIYMEHDIASTDAIQTKQDLTLLYEHIHDHFPIANAFRAGDHMSAFFLYADAMPSEEEVTAVCEDLQRDLLHVNHSKAKIYCSYVPVRFEDTDDDLNEGFMLLELSKFKKQLFVSPSKENIKELERHLKIEELIRKDFSDVGFYLDYQTHRDSVNRGFHGMEALVRIKDKELGRIGPNEFIPIIEENGRIRELTTLVVSKVAEDLSNMDMPKDFLVSINLSTNDLNSHHIKENVLAPFAKKGIAPEKVGFEITESVYLGDVDKAREIFKMIRASGHQLLLDDFGTGYSSLAYLKQLNFDYIKIDREFIRKGEETEGWILRTIALLCQQLGVKTIVEGVETKEQLETVQKLGFDFYQGFLDSIPTNIENIKNTDIK